MIHGVLGLLRSGKPFQFWFELRSGRPFKRSVGPLNRPLSPGCITGRLILPPRLNIGQSKCSGLLGFRGDTNQILLEQACQGATYLAFAYLADSGHVEGVVLECLALHESGQVNVDPVLVNAQGLILELAGNADVHG